MSIHASTSIIPNVKKGTDFEEFDNTLNIPNGVDVIHRSGGRFKMSLGGSDLTECLTAN